MAKRIAVLIFDGFSLVEASTIAEVFRFADEIEGERLRVESTPAQVDAPDASAESYPRQRMHASVEPYALVVVSSTGGSIASGATMRVWSDNLDAYTTTGLHALFIPGGSGAARLAADASFVLRLHTLMLRTPITKAIGEGNAILAAASQLGALSPSVDAPLATAAGAAVLDPHRERTVAFDDPLGPVAAALAVVKRDRGAQVARAVAERSAPGAWRRLGAILGEFDEGGTREKIDAAARWLRENYGQPVSVAKAAEVAAMSERSFLRRFKSQIGITPSEYLLRTRLDASCLLLVATDLPVDKIARRCGVGSGDGLAKMFRKRLAISPTEYRIRERRRAREH